MSGKHIAFSSATNRMHEMLERVRMGVKPKSQGIFSRRAPKIPAWRFDNCCELDCFSDSRWYLPGDLGWKASAVSCYGF